EVTAHFQLKGNDTIATRVDASLKPLQGTGGSGSSHHDQQGMSEHEKHQQQLNEGPRQLQGHTGAAMGKDSQDIPTKAKSNKEKQQQK
ncbi:MAG: hypothetical protein ACJ790_04750, partial [Myxococcaceae bacterium]